ncbi:sodium-dependent transporter [Helcobacillus massiliensis]|uniref:sodium-dependent transporter n=1 Tax=Helcobacillus massiliensis TaxID=521392 RepID=UPI002554E320|nr:sodium-dependent transporter [Helcobacillus massiliensis]MDK7743144.1 sodium-dependent transporter [Helcobacillus massiliensis]WOO92545.1 sodium-dependent transporter [Helcobacillus massiliensis]
MARPSTPAPTEAADRGAFSGRTAFIFAAIGSAVGLGNIWRFPYTAYDNGGGAFMIPYLIALLTAGIPLLFVDYAIGHRWRGSAPLAWRRMNRRAEAVGWWQVLICVVIGAYYAAILAWSLWYTLFSFTKKWGSDPAAFFGEFTQADAPETASITWDFVPALLGGILLVWILVAVVLALGVHKGIARSSAVFIPLLIVMFIVLVIRAVTLKGAEVGLNQLFQPDWSELTNGSVWVAAYGQIFFSLSVAFGIMLTYASYLKKKTDLTGSGLVVGFANSGFELLAGIGVFAALGFMATATGQGVNDVAAAGVGLAFIAFPAIINEAPMGELVGVLFFGSLVLAGFTSLISIIEVVVAAVQDKLGLGRLSGTLAVVLPMSVISVLLFSTTSGLNLLDVTDKFINSFGIVTAALVGTFLVAFVLRALPTLRDHLNMYGTFRVGNFWLITVAAVAPLILLSTLWLDASDILKNGYNGMPSSFVNTFGWGMAGAVVVVAVLLSLLPWSARSNAHRLDSDGDPIADPAIPDTRLEAPHGHRYPQELRADVAAVRQADPVDVPAGAVIAGSHAQPDKVGPGGIAVEAEGESSAADLGTGQTHRAPHPGTDADITDTAAKGDAR